MMKRELEDREASERILLELYDRHRHQLWWTAFELIENEEYAEDIVQSVVEKIWKDRIVKGTRRQQLAYVRKAVKNQTRDVIAAIHMERKGLIRLAASAKTSRDPEGMILTKELLDEVIGLVNSFSKKERELFRCKIWDDFSYEEISQMWHVQKESLYVQVHRLRQKLRHWSMQCLRLF